MQMSDFRPCTIVFFLFFLNVDIYIYIIREISQGRKSLEGLARRRGDRCVFPCFSNWKQWGRMRSRSCASDIFAQLLENYIRMNFFFKNHWFTFQFPKVCIPFLERFFTLVLYILVYLQWILKIARNFYSNLNVECLEMPNVLKELKIFD